MAPRLLQHEYLLAPMIWSDFEHFRMSGSIICRQLLLSLTMCVISASSFVSFLGVFIKLIRNLILLPAFDDIMKIFLFCSGEMYLCTRCSNAAKYCGSECDVMTLIDRDQHGQDLASLNYKKIAKFEEELYRVLC